MCREANLGIVQNNLHPNLVRFKTCPLSLVRQLEVGGVPQSFLAGLGIVGVEQGWIAEAAYLMTSSRSPLQ